MGAKAVLLIGGFAMATLVYLIYLAATYEPPAGTTTVVMPTPEPSPPVTSTQRTPAQSPVQTPAPAPEATAQAGQVEVTGAAAAAVTAPAEEVQAEPVEPVSESEPDGADGIPAAAGVELPALNNSDSFLAERLRQLDNGVALLSHLADEQLVRRFTVLVDNVSRENLPQSNLPYRGVEGEFPVQTVDDNLFEMDPQGFRRFDRAVDALVAMDAGQLVALYRLASPLFQQAYAELGQGDAGFDLALRRAIRNVLSTDDLSDTPQLVKPSVMYLYADSELEARSDIQKQMIRIGPENRERVKAKLREFLQAL